MASKILLVLEEPNYFPSGGELRNRHFIEALREVGEVKLFIASNASQKICDDYADRYSIDVTPGTAQTRSIWRGVVNYFIHRNLPWKVAKWPLAETRAALSKALRECEPDLVVLRRVAAFIAFDGCVTQPTIVDSDDLQSLISAQLLRSGQRARNPTSLRGRVRLRARRWFLRSEVRRWTRAEVRASERAGHVLLCSDDDMEELRLRGAVNTVKAPNGFDLEGSPIGRPQAGDPPTIGFWGLMAYAPNRVGAEWLMDEVLPIVRESIPDVRLLIAGGGSEQLTSDDPAVELLGRVPDIEDVLRRVDVAAVPLQAGGGTRIKIIEAWAHQIPVVSTTVGAHGLGPRSGDNCLVADEPAAFAQSLVLLLRDADLRQRLRDGGRKSAQLLTWGEFRRVVAGTVVEMNTPNDRCS